MTDRLYGWRNVVLVLAGSRSDELLSALGIAAVGSDVREWARKYLDRVQSFYEVYDIDPDGGAAARTVEGDLANLVEPAVLDALRDGADLLSRPIDGDLDDWSKAFFALRYQDDPDVPIPGTRIPDPLLSQFKAAEMEAGPAWLSVGEGPYDDWEREFGRVDDVWADTTAQSWAHLRRTRALVRRLAEILAPDDRAAFDAWAQAELYSDPRPATWPRPPHLSLAHSAR